MPRYLRCYDNGGETADRYTVVFTGRGFGGRYYIGASENPTHPQGFYEHGEAPNAIDRPAYSHLGKRVPFSDLPDTLRRLILAEYRETHPNEKET